LVSPYSSVSELRGDSPIHNGERNPGTWARQNLTMRVPMRRFTRLTNGFSKKVENLRAAVWLQFARDNFVRQYKSLRITPAMAAGVPERLWTLEELVEQTSR
jgi:hypothetical protein